MRQKNFTLLLLLALLCSTLPAGALRVKTENVAPGSKLDFNRVPGNLDISQFSTEGPYFDGNWKSNQGRIYMRAHHPNSTYNSANNDEDYCYDIDNLVICYMFKPGNIKGYINGSKEKKLLPNYAKITQVGIPAANSDFFFGATSRMNVKTYAKTILLNGEDAYGNPASDYDFFNGGASCCNRDSLLSMMGRAKKDTYVSTAEHETQELTNLSYKLDSYDDNISVFVEDRDYWNRPIDEHPGDFIRANFSTPYTWTYDYNNKGIMFMWDLRDISSVPTESKWRTRYSFFELPQREYIYNVDSSLIYPRFLDNAVYAGKGRGMLVNFKPMPYVVKSIFEPLYINTVFREDLEDYKDYNKFLENLTENNFNYNSEYFWKHVSCSLELGGEKATDKSYPTGNATKMYNHYFLSQSVGFGAALSFIFSYYTNDLRGRVLNTDSTSIADRVTDDQPSGRPLVRLYDVTAQRYITPDGKTLNAHGSFEVEADGSFEFPALSPFHRYQLSFASYSYGYYEINDIFFDPDEESHRGQPTSTAPQAVIPFAAGELDKYFDQRNPGKPYDLEMTLLLNKNDVTTGVANPGTGREVSRVRYFNMQGCESPQPHSGVNVVVTEYSDGGRSTAKKVIP